MASREAFVPFWRQLPPMPAAIDRSEGLVPAWFAELPDPDTVGDAEFLIRKGGVDNIAGWCSYLVSKILEKSPKPGTAHHMGTAIVTASKVVMECVLAGPDYIPTTSVRKNNGIVETTYWMAIDIEDEARAWYAEGVAALAGLIEVLADPGIAEEHFLRHPAPATNVAHNLG